MRKISRPALLPAIAFVLGSACPLALPVVPVPLLGALAAAGVAWGSESGLVLVCAAAGALHSAVRWVLPARAQPALDPERPVEALAEARGHPLRSAFGWTQEIRLLAVRQRGAGGAPAGEFVDPVQLALPDSVAPPPIGARFRATGYLRRGAGYANVPPTPPGTWRLAVKTQALLRVERPPAPWLRPAARLRSRLDALARGTGRASLGAGLAAALLIGDTSAIPDALRRDFRRTGLLHLLAVSGFNVGLLLGAVWLLSSWLALRHRVVLAAATLAVFVLTVGPLPSVLRAGWMGAWSLAALLARRPPVVANTLALSAVLLLSLSPRLLADLGFGLTFAATAGLVFLAPALLRALGRWPRWLAVPLSVTWAAQLATLPWSLLAFHQVQPLAVLFNLVYVPLASCAMLGDLAWAVVAVALPRAGEVLRFVPEALAWPFGLLAYLPPGPALLVPVGHAEGAWIALAALVATTLALRRRVALAAGVLLVTAGGLAAPPRHGRLEVAFLDVGQGDAALLRDGRHALLLDGGGWMHGDFGGSVVLPVLAEAGVRALDAIVMTHGDADHCRGLVDVADYVPVGELWLARSQSESPCARALLGRRGLRARYLAEGDHRALGRWRFDVLNPSRGPLAAAQSDNDGSLVLRVAAARRVFLFTGDVEAATEVRLAHAYAAGLRAAVLKVPHHGSRSSSRASFLDPVQARVAVLSAGVGNRFGHPHAEVLARLAERPLRLLRTDREGEIVFAFENGVWRLGLPASPRDGGIH